MALDAAKKCLDRSRISEIEKFVAFMHNRKIPWPLPSRTPSQNAAPPDVLDVLLDLAINWRVALWFDVTVSSSWTRDDERIVIIGEQGGVPALRMEQLAELDDVAYDDVARNLSAVLSGGRVTLDGATLEELRRDEAVFRQTLLSVDEEDEIYDDLVPLSDVTEVFGNAVSSALWTRLLSKHLNDVINVSSDTKLLIMNERRFGRVGGLVDSTPASRLLNVVGWTFAYAYAWIVNADFGFTSRSALEDLERERVLCFVAVQESFGIAQALPLYRNTFSQHQRQEVNDTLSWTTLAVVKSVQASPRIAKSTKTEAQGKIYALASSRQLWPPETYSREGSLDSIYANFTGDDKNFLQAWLGSREALRVTLAIPYYDNIMMSRYRWQTGSVLYLYSLNELRLSLSALLPPSYLRSGSGAMTYAGLGFNLARQVLRSVDLRGRVLDGAGRNTSWWQLRKPRESPCRLDASRSHAERRSIADLFALDVALTAMQKSSERNREKRFLRLKSLEGLSATQTFYVSYCSHYCGEPEGRRKCNVAMNGSEFDKSFGCHHLQQPTPHECIFV
ncbi:hypothetical protein HPB50_001784 [Hyalomma asiaticum]|uniref:Uncharacterized protein n=1 Tax=Hyalomma asiaticum TaxID=266040 RepID=A0ACB7T5E4_HYAAI|nr:hypothetical protein HPB50_001784 [Hyalomma asiaticum]